MSAATIAFLVALDELVKADRKDLAARIYMNDLGWPAVDHSPADRPLVVAAFLAGHIAAGHTHARIDYDEAGNPLGIACDHCLAPAN